MGKGGIQKDSKFNDQSTELGVRNLNLLDLFDLVEI